jgi:hypothetical protein
MAAAIFVTNIELITRRERLSLAKFRPQASDRPVTVWVRGRSLILGYTKVWQLQATHNWNTGVLMSIGI